MAANRIEFAYLLLNVCTVHMTSNVRSALQRCNTEVDYLPRGYTARLQPLDVGINGPFKGYIRQSNETFLVNTNGKANVHRRNVSRWIDDDWKKVSKTTIQNAWKKSGYNVTSLHDVYNGSDDENEYY